MVAGLKIKEAQRASLILSATGNDDAAASRETQHTFHLHLDHVSPLH